MRLRRVSIAVIILALALLTLTFIWSGATANGNQPPVASFTYSPEIPTPEETITFNASTSYDPDGQITQYTWNFGDGNITTAANSIITHSYSTDGTHTVELTVTDNSGSTGVAVAVVEVSTEVYFRVSFYGTLIPMSNIEVTVYYNNGSAWVKAPVGSCYLELRYDNMTQPNLASTYAQRFRNPGFTASILRKNASNVGFDIHPSEWTVFFKFKWGDVVTYWPNDTTRVYTYNHGIAEAHDYSTEHRAYWNATAGTYVIKAKNIPENGVAPTQYHPIIVGIMCPPPTPKYYLSVKTDPVGLPTIPGEGWYSANTNVTLTASQYANESANTRYRFSYWDVDGTSRGSGVNPITVQMNANHTATAHYIKQYSVTFTQSGLSSDATGTILTVDGAPKVFGELPFTTWADNGSSVTYSYTSSVSSSVSGKRYRLNSVTGSSSPITVTGPVTVTGNYVTQNLVTFAQTGLDSTATGTVVTVNSSAKTYGDMPYSFWTDSGSSVTYSYSSTVSSSVSGKKFVLVAVHCPPSPFTITGPTTIIGEYCCQYLVTFAQTGLDSTATGTVVTVNGSAKIYNNLPFTMWVNSGSSATYSYSSTVSSTVTGKQFRLTGVSGPSSPITVTSSVTVTGNYIAQYLVTFTQTGLNSSATGTVVTINSVAKTFADLPYTTWVDNGSSVTYSYSATVSSSISGMRFRLTGVSGPTSPITVSGPTTVTGNFIAQYTVTFDTTGLDGTAIGTIVTVNGTSKNFTELPFIMWCDNGSSVTYSYTPIVSSSIPDARLKLQNVTGPASPITVVAPTTVTGNYIWQYLVTFTHTGLDFTATGTVVTVNGNAKTYADLPYSSWIDKWSSVTYSYNDIVLSTVSGKQFKQVNVTGPTSPITVTSPVTVTGNYKTQYKVTFYQSGVGTDFTGTVVTIDSTNYNVSSLPAQFWWDQNSNHSFAYASPLIVNASLQYSWNSTSGLSTSQNGTLTITTSGSVTGNYMIGNCITFAQTGVNPDFAGTIVIVDGTPYGSLPVSFIWQIGTVHTFAFQSPLIVSGNIKRYVWTSTSGLSSSQNGSITVTTYGSIIGNYKTQYYLTVTPSPPGIGTPSGSGWYDDGTYASISTQQYVPGGSRYRFAGWTTEDMSEITDPSSNSTTVFVDKAKTVTANYVHQYLVTFAQTGLASDASGTVVTVNGTTKTYADLSYSVWVDEGNALNYSYEPTVASTISSKQFVLVGVAGPSSPITVTADVTVTGCYQAQYYLTITSPYGTKVGQGWYDSDSTAYAGLTSDTVDHLNGTRHVFTNWSVDASGTNYAQSDPITMNGARTAVANWKTQYNVTLDHTGLDSSASGTVVTVNSTPKTYGDLPYTLWVDAGSSVTYSYGNVSSTTVGKTFILIGVSGLPSPITVTNPVTVIGNYKTQYMITFDQSGVGSDFAGTIVTVDGTGYVFGTLPKTFWWDSGSSHSFSFSSPLVVNISRQYVWVSTTGLTSLQNGTLTITGTGSVTGIYNVEIKYQITFDQSGVGSDFTDTVVTIDGVNYKVANLSYSFWWDAGSIHNFAYQSPLIVTSNVKQYVWTSTTGLSTLQNGSITVTTSGSIIGNYKTQYYLTLATNPPGVDSPSGEGWYDANTNASIATDAFVDIVPGSSLYRFNGWTTADMAEITDPTRSPTTVLMDKGKTVTANYVIQYKVTFGQTGVFSDFGGTIVTVDSANFVYGTLSHDFWWDNNTIHNFAFQSPLIVTADAKQYSWISTTGLSTLQSGAITVSGSGSVTGNYKTQYYLTVNSSYGNPNPTSGWFNDGASVSASVTSPYSGPTGTRYVCTGWTGSGSIPTPGSGSSFSFTITQPSSITWNWKTQYLLTVLTSPAGLSPQPTRNPLGEAGPANAWWYDASTSVTLTAQSVTGYDFSYWNIDGSSQGNGTNPIVVGMNAPHTATARYEPSQFSVSINPTSASIFVGQSVTFTSTRNGGVSPYNYQWYLNNNPVAGATSDSWAFTSTTAGTYYVYLKVTDANSQTAQSETARIVVMPHPVGGYSVSLIRQTPASHIIAYVMLIGIFAAVLSLTKRKRK